MLYTETDREKRYIHGVSRRWLNAGLISAGQLEAIDAYTKLDLRVSNRFMQALFFFFTCVLCSAVVFLTDTTFHSSSRMTYALIHISYGVVFYLLAEYLVKVYRLFNFGIENALIFLSVILFNMGMETLLSLNDIHLELHTIMVCACVAASAAWVACRFGGTFWSLVCLVAASVIPFQLSLSPMNARLLLGSMLLLAFVYTYYKGQQSGFMYRKQEWKILQACLLIALYLSMNLRLSNIITNFQSARPALIAYAGFNAIFYWVTYLFVCAGPVAVLVAGVKKHERLFIDVGIVTMAITLITNKDYLGMKHYAWDPAVFGLVLIGVVMLTMKLLRNYGKKYGYTVEHILNPEHHGLDAAAIAMGIAGQSVSLPVDNNNSDGTFSGGTFSGGTSGGGGASRMY